MMDCRKPSSGFIDNIHEDLVEADGLKVGIAVIIIFFIMMIITYTIITTITIITIMTRWCSRAHRTATQGWMSSAAAMTAIVDHC